MGTMVSQQTTDQHRARVYSGAHRTRALRRERDGHPRDGHPRETDRGTCPYPRESTLPPGRRIEVGLTRRAAAGAVADATGGLTVAALQGKSFRERVAAFGSAPGGGAYCGHIGIFSEAGRGGAEDVGVDCSQAVAKLGGTEGVELFFVCVFDGATAAVTACPAAVPAPSLGA